jgi:hypothetical protein
MLCVTTTWLKNSLLILNEQIHILDLQTTLCVRIIWSFLSGPRCLTNNVTNVKSLTLCFDHPSWNSWIDQTLLIEVENHFLTLLEFGLHLML